MANSKTISVRVPEDLLSKIDHLAQEKYKSHKGVPNRSLVILDAIDAYCNALSDNVKEYNGITLSHTVTIEQFQSLQEVVCSLTEDLNALKSQVMMVSDTAIANDSVGKKNEGDIKSVDKLENLPIQLSVHQTEATIFNLEDLQAKPQISPIPRPIFAKRLKSLSHLKSSSAGTQLSKMKAKLGEGFWIWITEQDPDNIKWRYQKSKEGQPPGYVPKGDLSEEQVSNLLKWISENS
jgi:metal-responsive CopG/Arc/MetJ family transcriptional regulator